MADLTMNMTQTPQNREISPEGFRDALKNTFGNGNRMSTHIAGLPFEHWPRRLSRPDPKTCRSWINGDTDPGLTAVVYLLRAMKRVDGKRASNPWLARGR